MVTEADPVNRPTFQNTIESGFYYSTSTLLCICDSCTLKRFSLLVCVVRQFYENVILFGFYACKILCF